MTTIIRDIPLSKLVPSAHNVRRTGRENGIEELAASIAAHGLLQSLSVRPVLDGEGAETGRCEVVGGGRRLAALKLLAKRKQISKSAPVPCLIAEGEELSLAENVVRENLHPADQYEAFKRLVDEHGSGAEEIAARFGVTPQVVRQRLRLGAVSPKLMQVYREGGLTLDQLAAFAIIEDHTRQEDAFPEESANPAAEDEDATESEVEEPADQDEDGEDGVKPLPASLVRDLTAHRTLGLRLALGENPDVALLAVTHALAAQTFYKGYDEGTCLDIRPRSAPLGGVADGIEDTAAAQKLAERHASWAAQMPTDLGGLWGYMTALDHDSRMALFAHCTALTVSAVRIPWDRKPNTWATADALAQALALDMMAHWSPTARSYFERVTKAHILAAVREAVSDEAADRMSAMKKPAMAEAAEQLLAVTGWLPALLRTFEADRSESLGAAGGRTVCGRR